MMHNLWEWLGAAWQWQLLQMQALSELLYVSQGTSHTSQAVVWLCNLYNYRLRYSSNKINTSVKMPLQEAESSTKNMLNV